MDNIKKQIRKSDKEIERIIIKLKEKIKEQFWLIKGYPKYDTQNWAIVEEGIEFGIESMRK